MSSVINTNYLSLVAQNNLNSSQSALGTAITRLSSGLRINSAKDDAAGEAIANRFTANVNGLTQAARNANDGISIAQTTEGSLDEINNNLQRVRELTVQAANGTNSSSDLKSIQAEITQRLAEIDRVSAQTQFNGVKVLASDQTLTIQVGANDNETINVNLKQINSSTLGLTNLDVTNSVSSDSLVAAGNFKDAVAGKAATSATTVALDYSGSTPAAPSLVVGNDGKLYAQSAGSLYAASYDADTNTVSYNTAGTAAAASIAATSATTFVNGGTLTQLSDVKTAEADNAAGAPSFTVFQSNAGGTLTVTDGTKSWTIDGTTNKIDLNTGKVTLGGAGTTGAVPTAGTTYTAVSNDNVLTLPGTDAVATVAAVAYNTTDAFASLGGTNTLEKDAKGNLLVKNVGTDGTTTYFTATADASGKVTAGDEANVDPLANIDKAISTVDSFRSDLGAIQNRFESTITNLNNTVNNLSDARSRIQDADYATEVSNMSRAQILQQAGTSVLAQANQVPQTVLSLLR
ncbi:MULTISPECIES: flagellin [unclassified Achromobacter]|uniref:flagellin N-terminal helical domain-containing protein n=1 Tax=unclassified Achromobacter TaxID=2626865 RepID=UPI000B51B017|nr:MULTISPECIES: flagellin [unclassified Achromobacter]OWT79936.1 flagellin FliC [Achromobacter sp. HZ34]OWT81820.1 flagellin FliC [Achromobacter sp. HZ28]